MIGSKNVRSWLQAENDLGLTSPAALAGLSGIMAQQAMRQTMAEITQYLVTIDQKVDEVLRKVDDAQVAQLGGAGAAIEQALSIREHTGTVNETLWSTVAQTRQTIAAAETYALFQLEAVASGLEDTKVRGLAEATTRAEASVPKWLAVLARCFQLQEAVNVLELDRVLAETPEVLSTYRRGLKQAQNARRELIAEHTARLLNRIDDAVVTANAKLVWTRAKSLAVVESANQLATGLHGFHGVLQIESAPETWDLRQLNRPAAISSQAIQLAKDKGPIVASGAGLIGVAVLGKQRQS